MARITYIPNRVIDTNGISDGASVHVYQAGGTTPVTLYSDEALTVPVSNPYVVASGAAVPALYHGHNGNIRVRVVASDGTVPQDDDPYERLVSDVELRSADTGKGAELLGFKQSGTGMATQNSLTILRRTGVWLDDHPDADSAGASDSKTALDATIAATIADSRALIIPHGEFKLSSTTLPTTGPLVIEGKGEDSQLIVNAANQAHLLSLVAGGRLRLYNLRLIGDGTSTSSSEGRGLFFTDVDDIELDSVIFDNFGFASVFGRNTTVDQISERTHLRNLKIYNGKNPARGYNADIMLWSNQQRLTLENIYIDRALGSGLHNHATIANAINPSADTSFDGIQITDVTPANALGVLDPPDKPVFDVHLENIRVIGGTGRGVAVGSEYANPSNTGNFKIVNFTAENCGCAAWKHKNIGKVQLSNVYAKGCDRLGGEQPTSGLSGTLLFNGSGTVQGSNLSLEDCGQEGMTLFGIWTGDEEGVERGRTTIDGLIVNKNGLFTAEPTHVASGGAIYSPYNAYDVSVTGFVANDVKQGVYLRSLQDASGSTATAPARWVFNSPIIKRTTNGAGSAFRVLGDASRLIGPIVLNAPIFEDCAGNGISAVNFGHFEVNGGLINGCGVVASGSGRGIILAGGNYAKLNGVTVNTPNSLGAAGSFQALALTGANAYVEAYDNNFSGGTANIALTVIPTEFRFGHNKGILDGRPVGATIGNGPQTVDWAVWGTVQYHSTTLTADQILTLTAGLYNGMTFKVTRPTGAAFTLNVQWSASTIKAMAGGTWAEFIWTGSAWVVLMEGTL